MTKRSGRTPAILVVLLGAAFLPTAGVASVVTWQFTGQISDVDVSDGLLPEFGGISPDDPFLTSFTFDTDSQPDRIDFGAAGGFRYSHFSSVLSATLTVGNVALARPKVEFRGADSVVIRDNFADAFNVPYFPPDEAVDGISFVWSVAPTEPVGSTSDAMQFRIRLQGQILDLFASASLPELPDPRLVTLPLTRFDLVASRCFDTEPGSVACSDDILVGQVVHVAAVPAPPAFVLLLTGCLAMAGSRASRRRKVMLTP